MIQHHFKESTNYYDYCKKMSDVTIPYDEVCVIALGDLLQKNVTIVTPHNVWSLLDNLAEDRIVVVMVALNNVYGTRRKEG